MIWRASQAILVLIPKWAAGIVMHPFRVAGRVADGNDSIAENTRYLRKLCNIGDEAVNS
jgi:hypothetical protein